MSIKRKYFICDTCKNIVGLISDGGGALVCCGEPMRELKAGEVDAAAEKHVPVVRRDGTHIAVEVGSVPHPQTAEHHIAWIAACSEGFTQRKELPIGVPPACAFAVSEGPVTVYAYCNLHGLWEASV